MRGRNAHAFLFTYYITKGVNDMPNLMMDFLASFGSSTSAGSTVVDMVKDAKTIKDTVMGGAKNAKETYRDMRQHGFRKVTDWFFQRGDEYGLNSSLDDDSDDFDAGFSYGSDDEGDSSQVLDYEGMKGIAKGQVSAMYNIAGKQAEATAMTASEVISNLNDRSAEILSSLGTINSSLESISQKLEKLVVVTAAQNENDRASVFDANGNLSMGGIFNVALGSIKNSTAGQMIDFGKSMIGSAKDLTPGKWFGMLTHALIGDTKFKALHDQSVNEISDALTDKFMNFSNMALTKLLEQDWFKKAFGNQTQMSGGKDYAAYIENQYTRDKAVFDGMTRKTIVDVIPSYLRKITEALTGQTYHISEYGTLTTEKAEGFQQVARNVIADGLKSKQITSILSSNTSGESIDENDVRMAQRILLGLYVGVALDEQQAIMSSDALKDGGNEAINAEAAQILGRTTNKPTSYWMTVIALINESFNNDAGMRESFVRKINQTVQVTDAAGQQYASTATFIDDIGEISHDMIVSALEENVRNVMDVGGDTRTYDDLIKAKEITEADMPPGAKRSDRVSDAAIRQAKLNRARQSSIVTDGQISIRSTAESTIDYLASIFELLNRGVNVYPVKQKKKFSPMPLTKAHKLGDTAPASPPPPEIVNEPPPSPKPPSGGDDDTQPPPVAGGAIPASGGDDEGPAEQPSHVETNDDGPPPPPPPGGQQAPTPGQQLADSARGLASSVTNFMRNPNTIAGKVRGALSNEWSNLKGDVLGWKDDALNAAAGWADRQVDENGRSILQRDVEAMDDANDDKQKAQEVLAAMQTAAADGDTQEDLASISSQIADIKDPKLKARLDRMVSSVLKRSENKKPAKSKLGGILLWGFGLAKKFLSGVFSKAKTFLTKFGKGIVTPIINSLKSSLKKITTGAKAVKEGFIGSKTKYRKAQPGEAADEEGYALDADGNRIVERQGSTGLVQDVIAWGKNSKSMRNLREAAGHVKDTAKTLGGLAVDKTVDTVKDVGNQIKDWWNKQGILHDVTQMARDKFVDTAGKIGGQALILKDKFAETSFGKGFMEAFKDPEEEARKKNPEPKTAADVATKTIAEMLKNIDGKGEGGKETAISMILGYLQTTAETIQKKLDGAKEEPTETDASTVETDDGTPEGETTSETTPAEGSTPDGTTTAGITAEQTPQLPSPSIGDGGEAGAAPAAAAEGGGGGIGSKLKGMLSGGNAGGIGFDIGKMLGGVTKILMGIGQAVLTIIMSMEGFKAIMNIGTEILQKSLKPLNKAFQSIYKALKPIVNTITRLLKEIVGYVVDIVQSVIKTIQPILEAIEPIISSLLETLMPLLELVTGLVNVLLVPLTALIKVTLIPTLQAISNTLEIILGIVQVGMGIILTALGGILVAVGTIVKWLTGSSGIKETGQQLWDTGTNMVKSGAQSVVSGMKKTVSLFTDTVKDVLNVGDKDEDEDNPKRKKKTSALRGSALEGTYGSGDESLDETFGGAGANQRKYGTYLNMANRGCGPVAIADAYARRTGHNVDAAQLATSMNSAGTYSQKAGTSVSGYIKTSRALGMNLTPGVVTSTSLRHATPDNPITIVGSGPSFTTRAGNNHYMNVVGSDSHGTAYVSNPLTGKIERKNINTLATSSVLGLYGSGNVPLYEMNDDVKEAVANLKAIVQSVISIFTGDSSVEAALEKEEQNADYDRMQQETADMTEEEQNAIDKKARELFEKEHGRYKDETDAQFEKRYQKYKKKYWAMAAAEKVKEKVNASMAGSDEGAMSVINATLGDDENPGMISNFSNALTAVDDSVQPGGLQSLLESISGGKSKKEKGAARYESDHGAVMWTDMYSPEIRKNTGAGWTRNADQRSYKLILDEFFRNTVSPNIKITGAFKRYLDPVDDNMVGTRGEEHSGADFTIGGNPEIHATTGGRVVDVGIDNDHFGNYVKVQDVGGDFHIYAHLKDVKVSKGDTIEGGDVIGTMGHSGKSQITILNQSDASHGNTSLVQSGDRLHYEIRDEDNTIVNPFTFFKYKSGGGKNGAITLEGKDAMFRAASEVFTKAAEYSNQPGKLLHNVTSSSNVTFDDGFVIDSIPSHCTGMMGAVVKRMGYYTYPAGKEYTDTYQGEGYMGGDVATKWGIGTGKAKIYNRDGSLSSDWETGPGSAWQPGDIMFNSTGNAHAHMPVFPDTGGQYLGFNGGQDASFANSITLGKYILEHGEPPTDVTNKQTEGNHYSDQIGALAGPMSYYIRYVGDPVTFTGEEDDSYYGDEYFSEDEAAAMTQAGVDAAIASQVSKDEQSVVPRYWKKSTNSSGYVENAAHVRLASWYYPTGNANADEAWRKSKNYNYVEHLVGGSGITGLGNVIVYVADFANISDGTQTVRGWFEKNTPKSSSKSSKSSSTKSSVITTPTVTDAQMKKYLSYIYKGGYDLNGKPKVYSDAKHKTPVYFSDWDKRSIASRISSINGNYNYNGLKYSLTQDIIRRAIQNKKELWNMSAADANTGTNVINPGVNTSRSTTTTTTVGSKSSSAAGSSGWWDSIVGAGDASTIVPDTTGVSLMDQIGSIVDPAISEGSPIIVNQYATQQPVDGDDPIGALLTNTYNVRSEKIESILEDMLALMKERNQRKRNKQSAGLGLNNPTADTSFSTENIPRSVERLSVG